METFSRSGIVEWSYKIDTQSENTDDTIQPIILTFHWIDLIKSHWKNKVNNERRQCGAWHPHFISNQGIPRHY